MGVASRRRVLAWLAAALLAPAAVTASSGLVDRPAPDFALAALDGRNLRLSEFRGRVVLINFWATWCGPCRQEMPLLDEIHRRYEPAGLTLLGINVDGDPAVARRYAEDVAVGFPLLVDEAKEVSRLYDIRAMPVTVLVARDGTVRHVHHGYKRGYEERYVDQLRELLRED